jgi:exosome complex component CSL4
MEESFKPGDIVIAQVLSIGDSRSYFLGTDRPELGVLYGKADSGETLAPISAEFMAVAGTTIKERRKVARPPTV